MRCYICERPSEKLFPMMKRIGKLDVTIYVCKECFKENVE